MIKSGIMSVKVLMGVRVWLGCCAAFGVGDFRGVLIRVLVLTTGRWVMASHTTFASMAITQQAYTHID